MLKLMIFGFKFHMESSWEDVPESKFFSKYKVAAAFVQS